jgi:hypothetical protein
LIPAQRTPPIGHPTEAAVFWTTAFARMSRSSAWLNRSCSSTVASMYPRSICESLVRLTFALTASSDAGISAAILADRSLCELVMAMQQHVVAEASIIRKQEESKSSTLSC